MKETNASPPTREIRTSALDSLARREHSRAELERKLKSKGYDSDEISEHLQRLVEQGLLDDNRFTESYIHYRAKRGYGPLRIEAELRARGVSDELIAQGLAESAFDWNAELQRVWEKKFGRDPRDFQEQAKQARFLEYRGYFGSSVIKFLESRKSMTKTF